MDFNLTPDQKELISSAKAFAREQIRPAAIKADQSGICPDFILKNAYDAGFTYSSIPKVYGGTGLSHLDHCMLTETLNYECCAIGQMMGISHLATAAILIGGTQDQKSQFLGRLTSDYKGACFCLTEPEAGSDAARMQTTAVKTKDRYVVNGSKCFITNGRDADLLCLFATIDPNRGNKGICCFAVPRDTPGISVGRIENKMGQRALTVAQLHFTDLELSEDHLIGQEGQGFKLAMMALDRGRMNIAAISTAIAQKALDLCVERTRERVQFGQPVAQFQGVHFTLADMHALVTASRAMYLQAAWMLDQGMPVNIEAASAKCFASDAAMRVTTDAVQLFGGSGYMTGAVVEKLMRDAKLTQIYEGTNQINRIVSGLGLLKRDSRLF